MTLKAKQYAPGTVASILEDRLADLLVHKTIDEEQFVPYVMADIQQDGWLLQKKVED